MAVTRNFISNEKKYKFEHVYVNKLILFNSELLSDVEIKHTWRNRMLDYSFKRKNENLSRLQNKSVKPIGYIINFIAYL